MTAAAQSSATLGGWLSRDLGIAGIAGALLFALDGWHAAYPGWLSYGVCATSGFIAAYVVCYITHEWGHLLGARASGAHMPLAPYRGVPIGYFDITRHSRRQFLFLSWGGVTGYLLIMALCVVLYATLPAGPITAGLAVGGLAFVFQSLSVDLPQIFKVIGGADPYETNKSGASAAVILRRTWQSWLVLAALLAGRGFLTG